MTSIWDRANPQLRGLAVYEPGKPIEETARELNLNPSEIVKLASNENPLGPSPKAVTAMRNAIESSELYPDGGAFHLRNALAGKLGVAPENLIIGNGSNEIIEFFGHAFLKPGDEVVTTQHAFIAYKLIATLFGARTVEVPTPDFHPDLEAVLRAITPETRLIFIANPNNPTGVRISQDQVDNFVSRIPDEVVAVFDEAYFEFIEHPADVLQYVGDRQNVAVLRTFSKIHGLASLRIGYGVGSRELMEILQKTRQPFNINGIGQAAALAALLDEAHQVETKRVIDQGRAYLQGQFSEMKLSFVPGAANFVMVNVGDGRAVFDKLLPKKVIVRPLKGYGLPEWVRISVGTMEQNKQCISALKEILAAAR